MRQNDSNFPTSLHFDNFAYSGSSIRQAVIHGSSILGHLGAEKQDASPFAEMLSLPNDGRYPALELASQPRRQRTLEALIIQLEALTRSNPVLMIFEDAH
jgi:predicted ATPase